MGDRLHCCIRIKKEELLYLKLAMEIDIKKPRTKRKKIMTPTGVFKTVAF